MINIQLLFFLVKLFAFYIIKEHLNQFWIVIIWILFIVIFLKFVNIKSNIKYKNLADEYVSSSMSISATAMIS